MSERPLPHSPEAERLVLAAILLDNPERDEVLRCLDGNDFYLPQHRVIYCRLKQQVEQGCGADIVLLMESLKARGELEKAGGCAYLAELLDGMPRVFQIRGHIELIKQKALLRQRAKTADAILEMALGANGDAAEVLQEIANLSAHLREEVGQKRILNFRTGAELATTTAENVPWILKGLIAEGAITEIGAKVKAGKTTLILAAVRAVLDGLTFLNEPTAKMPVVYLTEQLAVSFRQAMVRADLLGRDDFVVLAHGEVWSLPWPQVAGAVVTKCKNIGARLLVVDTLPQFAGLVGDSENNSGDALAAMQPLQRAAEEGIGVVALRHERKSGGEVGDSGRGSSAFGGAADIMLALRRPEGNSRRTVRLVQALSRFSETPAELLIELTEKGYIALGAPHEAEVKEAKDALVPSAPRSESEAVDLKDLAAGAKLARATAQRAVEELLCEGMLSRIGEGKRGKPFRYFMPENPFCPTSNIGGQKEKNGDKPQ
jgi:hypothetical protein